MPVESAQPGPVTGQVRCRAGHPPLGWGEMGLARPGLEPMVAIQFGGLVVVVGSWQGWRPRPAGRGCQRYEFVTV